MDILQSVVNYILDLGAEVFVPALMIIIGLIVGMKVRNAFNAGIILGVAFIGMNLVIGFMLEAITPAAQALAELTGINLTAVDGGWTTAATITWAWPYAFLMFPIQLAINGIMLLFNWTKTLNVDLWNVWGKIFTAVLIMGITGNMYIAFVGASVVAVVELLLADLNQLQIEKVTGIPGVTVTHGMNILAVSLMPLDWVLRRIKLFNKKMDASALREKIGVFAENNVMGAIIGLLLGFAAGYSVADALILSMQAAAALTLFPMIAKLFMEALSPLSEAINEFMKKRFKGREMFIGLDWPILAGSNEVWVTIILTIPFTLLLSFILPGNEVLPFAGILNIGLAVPALIVTGGNLLRMLILSILGTPVFLYAATYFTDIITNLAESTNAVKIEEGQRLTWSTIEYPVIRYILTELGSLTILGISLAVIWVLLFIFYRQQMTKRNKELSITE
ncbi:PTS galactitol transporter subunit IIC [Lentibacillus populi]|uniref:PTS galactitol transporter subunit IIC n=1 Tax=Lentibacillus populi TaxID=1827502 RepID=A0A9W5U1T0_9BACI|nr:PTS transporter subunit IIC [Lentibacillus populi]MBT2216034.1 PTS galactitol transporter subunit IIC [Virgibacillus dakarensis]GGB58615.1 PTS galactitol transporter subunit IIC [Lentibacillus populi]